VSAPARPVRVYADTSVFGGTFELVTSPLVAREILNAPPQVRALFADLIGTAHIVKLTGEAERLRDAYTRFGIVGPRSADDALHVATATVTGCSVIVSWNFRHIVNFQRIPLYNAINTLNGYAPIAIHSPPEVLGDEDV